MRTGDGVEGVGVFDLPEAGAAGVAQALRLELTGQVCLNGDETIAVGVLWAVRQRLHIHLPDFKPFMTSKYPSKSDIALQVC